MAKEPNNELNEEEESTGRLTKVAKGFESHIQRRTLDGLIQLVPLLVTILVLQFLIKYADGIRQLPFVRDQPWDFTGIGLLLLIVLFYVLGVLASLPPGRKVLDLVDLVLNHIPVVKNIYGVTHQAMSAITSQYNFSRVVFLEWPREGMAAMGFVTGRVYSANREESMVLIYIPTVPNPTSGNMALVLEDEVLETDLSVDAAMKLVFSGGIVLPESISMARVPRMGMAPPRFTGRFETRPD